MLTLVVGVGNPWRGDDAAGLEVVRRIAGTGVEVRTLEGDASALLEAWAGHEHVALVDAAAPAPAPARCTASARPRAAAGVRPALLDTRVRRRRRDRARGALGRLPARLDVYAIEGEDFALGAASRRRSRARSTRSRDPLHAPRAELRRCP